MLIVIGHGKYEEYILCYGFWSDAKPCVFCHPYALIILLPYLEALVPVPK
jgi:hypothetical protein